jgi:hypothetical protein
VYFFKIKVCIIIVTNQFHYWEVEVNRRLVAISVLLILAILLTSCGFTLQSNTPPLDENGINTAVAQTLAANGGIAATITPQAGVPTNTVQVQPSITPQPLATLAQQPSPTPTTDACNLAKYETDVTIEDGSVLAPDTAFTKTWRLTNTGTCTWTTNYAIVYSGGDQMGALAATNLPGSVAPGATVDVSVQMKSPSADGKYAGNFMLRSDTGLIFGTGASHMAPIFVSIEVVKQQIAPTLVFGGILPIIPLELLAYNFGADYCVANWRNATDAGFLACPGDKTDASGFVVQVDSPKLQDGNTVNGVGLFTHPQWIDGGSIAGIYPLFKVEDGMKFRATLGCGFGGAACDVRFMLRYKIEGGALQELTHWDVKYTDAPLKLDVDLSSLAGKNVNFVLQVVTNGSSAQDWAYWVNPRIVK